MLPVPTAGMTNMRYLISYTDHRRDGQEIRCSSFEDAERLLEVATEFWGAFGPVLLSDGYYTWKCEGGVIRATL